MKSIHLIAALFLFLGLKAQNWNNTLPGTKPFHIHAFYNDTATGKLIATGGFDSAGNVAVPGIAAWDGTSWSSIGTGMPSFPPNNSILCAFRYNGDLLFGGYIPSWNTNNAYILKWDGTTLDSFAALTGDPIGMLQYQNDLIVYGSFTSVQTASAGQIARWDGASWSDLGFGAFNLIVRKMIVYHGDLYAMGVSTTDYHFYVYRLVNNNTWQIVGQSFSGSGSSQILDLCIYNDELYAGGYFSMATIPAGPGNSIAKLDTVSNTWSNVGGGLASDTIAPFAQVSRMAVHDGALYAIGWFDHAGGAYAPYLAKWDGTQWCGFDIGFSYLIFSIADYDDTLYLGTGPVFDNDTSYGFVKWIGGNYTDTCGVISTGVDEQAQEKYTVKVFPNPATSTATFQMPGIEGSKTIIITDQLGKEIWRKESGEKEIEFSAEGFAPGLYFYRMMHSGNIAASGKLVIQ
jgi:hypothetical protein